MCNTWFMSVQRGGEKFEHSIIMHNHPSFAHYSSAQCAESTGYTRLLFQTHTFAVAAHLYSIGFEPQVIIVIDSGSCCHNVLTFVSTNSACVPFFPCLMFPWLTDLCDGCDRKNKDTHTHNTITCNLTNTHSSITRPSWWFCRLVLGYHGNKSARVGMGIISYRVCNPGDSCLVTEKEN